MDSIVEAATELLDLLYGRAKLWSDRVDRTLARLYSRLIEDISMTDVTDACRSSTDLLDELKRLAVRALVLEGDHLFGDQSLTPEQLAEWEMVVKRHNEVCAILIKRRFPRNSAT